MKRDTERRESPSGECDRKREFILPRGGQWIRSRAMGGNKQRPKGESEQMKSGDRRARMQGKKQARTWVDA